MSDNPEEDLESWEYFSCCAQCAMDEMDDPGYDEDGYPVEINR